MEPDYQRKESYYRHGIDDIIYAFAIAFDGQRFRYDIYQYRHL